MAKRGNIRELRGAVGEAAAEEDARGRRARELRREAEQSAQQLEDDRAPGPGPGWARGRSFGEGQGGAGAEE